MWDRRRRVSFVLGPARAGDRLAVRSRPTRTSQEGPILIAPGMVPSSDAEVQRRHSQAKRSKGSPHCAKLHLKAVASTGLALAHPPVSLPPSLTRLDFHTPPPPAPGAIHYPRSRASLPSINPRRMVPLPPVQTSCRQRSVDPGNSLGGARERSAGNYIEISHPGLGRT